jgi:hypothetical protein
VALLHHSTLLINSLLSKTFSDSSFTSGSSPLFHNKKIKFNHYSYFYGKIKLNFYNNYSNSSVYDLITLNLLNKPPSYPKQSVKSQLAVMMTVLGLISKLDYFLSTLKA